MSDIDTSHDEDLLRSAVMRACELEVEVDQLRETLAMVEQERDDMQLEIDRMIADVDRAIDNFVTDIDKAIRG